MKTSLGRYARVSPLVLALLAACGPPRLNAPARGQNGGNGPARPAGSSSGDPGAGSAPGAAPTFVLPDAGIVDASAAARPDMTCGMQRHQLNRLAPEILLVLDRSGSMREAV